MSKSSVGSIWRLWDFHAHTPASYQWDGEKLRNADPAGRERLIKATIDAMVAADPSVFVIMDYWTFDGYRAIREYLKANPDALGTKKVFPGIELRVESSSSKSRLNVHLILDPNVEAQTFDDVLADLKLDIIGSGERGLSDQCFIQYARALGNDKLKNHQLDPARVQSEDDYALLAGWQTAEIKPESLKKVLENNLVGRGLMLLPWDTYGGLRDIEWARHYGEVRRMLHAADIFECKNSGNRAAFHGQRTDENKDYFDDFWTAINETPRLCVRGTDAHKFKNYGVFPSGMKTWIKADPTYRGLLQAIREPYFRSYIGDLPPKRAMVEEHGRLFMTRIQVSKLASPVVSEKWFDGVDLELNPDLIAVIGNKGSGKSGLAEVLALTGNSKSQGYFTFFNDKRFRSGNVPRGSAFSAGLTWQNGDVSQATLDSEPKPAEPERVKYISQSYFEELCNEHVTGKSDRFGLEIRKVLFSNMDPAERLDFRTLDDYLKAQEQPAADRIADLRQKLAAINEELLENERLASPQYANELKDTIAKKDLALKDLDAKKPQPVPTPVSAAVGDESATEQQRLSEIAQQLTQLTQAATDGETEKRRLTERRNALTRVIERLQLFSQQTGTLNTELEGVLTQVGIQVSPIISLTLKTEELKQLQLQDLDQTNTLEASISESQTKQAALVAERTKLQEKLDAPNKAYQEFLIAQKTWETARVAILGAADVSDSLEYYRAKLKALDVLPQQKAELAGSQEAILRAIHKELADVSDSRKVLFEPVERVIEQFPAIKEDLKVAFQSNLFFNRQVFIENFFQLVKQNTGGFKGEEEGQAKLNDMIRRTDFSSPDTVVSLMQSILKELLSSGGNTLPVGQVLRTGKTSGQLYELLFGLHQLEAKFSLSLAGTTIQQMSPGQRGALLLIFYLLVDSDQSPLILDQPEENLDNQTVYSMLVPIIQRAKNRRQIVMVTHNANLAVCCDAEQIIYAEFDRTNQLALRYQSGSIEDAALNGFVVNVLEGTEPAFGNRRDKYITKR